MRNRNSRTPDFEVRYKFFDESEGGRKALPFQGYRCDWIYADFETSELDQAWMIWPVFVDKADEPVLENEEVEAEGIAQMIILNEDLRQSVHKKRIRLGIEGYFVEGSRKVAEATVVRVVGLEP